MPSNQGSLKRLWASNEDLSPRLLSVDSGIFEGRLLLDIVLLEGEDLSPGTVARSGSESLEAGTSAGWVGVSIILRA